ncbi:putative PetM of cytochrome b6/f complex subunit 7 [Helianthus anomalus]
MFLHQIFQSLNFIHTSSQNFTHLLEPTKILKPNTQWPLYLRSPSRRQPSPPPPGPHPLPQSNLHQGLHSFGRLKAHNIVASLSTPVSTEQQFANSVCSLKKPSFRGGTSGGALTSTCKALGEIFKITVIMNGITLVGVAIGLVLLRIEASVEESYRLSWCGVGRGGVGRWWLVVLWGWVVGGGMWWCWWRQVVMGGLPDMGAGFIK